MMVEDNSDAAVAVIVIVKDVGGGDIALDSFLSTK
jgi:hypothetical protein